MFLSLSKEVARVILGETVMLKSYAQFCINNLLYGLSAIFREWVEKREVLHRNANWKVFLLKISWPSFVLVEIHHPSSSHQSAHMHVCRMQAIFERHTNCVLLHCTLRSTDNENEWSTVIHVFMHHIAKERKREWLREKNKNVQNTYWIGCDSH